MSRTNVLLGLIGLLALAAVMAFGVIGTGAWFSDQSQVPVSATSGTLDIRAEVAAQGSTSKVWYDPTGVPITVANLAPGVYDPDNVWMIDVQNKPAVDSSLAAKYRYTAAYVSGSSDLWDNVKVKVETGNCLENPGVTISGASTVYEGKVKNLSFTNADAGQPDLPVNYTHCYRFSFTLPNSAGNDLQGLSGVFNIVIDATQPENPGF